MRTFTVEYVETRRKVKFAKVHANSEDEAQEKADLIYTMNGRDDSAFKSQVVNLFEDFTS